MRNLELARYLWVQAHVYASVYIHTHTYVCVYDMRAERDYLGGRGTKNRDEKVLRQNRITRVWGDSSAVEVLSVQVCKPSPCLRVQSSGEKARSHGLCT